MNINLTWIITLITLIIFFILLIFMPMPTCTKISNFEIGNSTLGAKGSYCSSSLWKSLYMVYTEKHK